MQIITTREFRANQKKYFELAEKETIFVSRRNAAPIVVYAATEEDFPSREELEAIQRGMEDIKQGRTFKRMSAMYEIEFSKEAAKHVLLLRKSSPQLFKKLERLLDELKEHPYTGTGHPEQLKYLQGVWSRQLDKKNRIRYTVNETTIVVFVISVWGHYDDK